jgi:hypothetical protein
MTDDEKNGDEDKEAQHEADEQEQQAVDAD